MKNPKKKKNYSNNNKRTKIKFEYPLIIRGLCVNFQTVPKKKGKTEKLIKNKSKGGRKVGHGQGHGLINHLLWSQDIFSHIRFTSLWISTHNVTSWVVGTNNV